MNQNNGCSQCHQSRFEKETGEMKVRQLEVRLQNLEERLKLMFPDYPQYVLSSQSCAYCEQRWLMDVADHSIVWIPGAEKTGGPPTPKSRFRLPDSLDCECKGICYRCLRKCEKCEQFSCPNHLDDHQCS